MREKELWITDEEREELKKLLCLKKFTEMTAEDNKEFARRAKPLEHLFRCGEGGDTRKNGLEIMAKARELYGDK